MPPLSMGFRSAVLAASAWLIANTAFAWSEESAPAPQDPPAEETKQEQERAIAEYEEFVRNLRSRPAAAASTLERRAVAPSETPPRDRKKAAESRRQLREAWEEFLRDPGSVTDRLTRQSAAAQGLALPQRVQLARESERPFVDPPVIRSKDGVLNARLIVDYEKFTIPKPIGEDRVMLRTYNGKLVGPTLRAKPGDTLRIILENRLDADPHTEPVLVVAPALTDVSEIPSIEPNQLIIASVNDVLYFRWADEDKVTPLLRDTDETAANLAQERERILDLKDLVRRISDPSSIPDALRRRILTLASSILGDPLMNTYHGLNTTNLHTHGLHVSPAGNSDNVMLQINGRNQFEYEINIPKDHPAGTFWYHAHKHGSTSAHVASGMAGALIIEGGVDEIPEIAAMKQRVLVFQQLSYAPLPGFPFQVIEEENVADVFRPTSWAGFQRHTAINGQTVPKITIRPGEIQRWRMVHAGVRATLFVRLVQADGLGDPIPLHQIAVDGLPLGKMETHLDPIELWPGYRSDVLVEAPIKPGKYLLIAETTAPADSINGIAQPHLSTVASVVVEGEPTRMALPHNDALQRFRLASIRKDELATAGKQTMSYDLSVRINPSLFGVDGRPYDATEVRRLKLGEVDVWKLGVGGDTLAPHVFHIHVNPFEVISDIDESLPEDDPNHNLIKSPVWRDTYVIRPGRVVKIATKYTRYIGEFVQHCHILDHEDQGMMEQVSIEPPGGLMGHGHASGADDAAPASGGGHAPAPSPQPHGRPRPAPQPQPHGEPQPE